MARDHTEQQHDATVVAIERVLEAERVGETRLQTCRQQAAARVAGAREEAAAIARRADARIAKLHTAYLDKVNAEIADLRVRGSDREITPAVDEAALARAAQRLAAKLTGAA